MNQHSQDKGQRRKKEYFFLCCWHSWASSGPNPISKVNFQSSPDLWWVSILVENRDRTQNRMVEERSVKLNYERPGRARNLARTGEASWSESEGAVCAAVLRLEACGIPETLSEIHSIKNHLTRDTEIVICLLCSCSIMSTQRSFLSMWCLQVLCLRISQL